MLEIAYSKGDISLSNLNLCMVIHIYQKDKFWCTPNSMSVEFLPFLLSYLWNSTNGRVLPNVLIYEAQTDTRHNSDTDTLTHVTILENKSYWM
jgi:hypothetical protein